MTHLHQRESLLRHGSDMTTCTSGKLQRTKGKLPREGMCFSGARAQTTVPPGTWPKSPQGLKKTFFWVNTPIFVKGPIPLGCAGTEDGLLKRWTFRRGSPPVPTSRRSAETTEDVDETVVHGRERSTERVARGGTQNPRCGPRDVPEAS